MTRLERLEVHGFRGLLDSSLSFDCGSIVLGGGNGTGKSAFVDALEFLYTGSISSLAGAAGLSLRQHAPHILASARESFVRAGFDTPRGTATRWLSGPVDAPAPLDVHLVRGGRLTFILRRSQLQQFIHATPSDRYRGLADLIGVETLDRIELGLKRARDTLQSALTTAQATMATIERQLETLPADRDDEEELLRAVNDRIADLGFPEHQLQSFDDVPAVRASLLRRLTDRRPDPRFSARSRLLDELRRGINGKDLGDALAAFVSLVPRAGNADDRARGLELLSTLTHGRDYLRRAETHHCPLCEREVDSRSLLARLSKRVAQLEELSLHQERLQRARDALEASLRDAGARARTVEAMQREAGFPDRTTGAVTNCVTMLQESLRAGTLTESLEMAARLDEALQRWSSWARDTVEGLAGSLAGQDGAEESEAHDAVLALLQDLGVRRARSERGHEERERLRSERDEIQRSLHRRRRALALAEASYATFNRVKNAEIQRVYNELQSDLARFYDFLHPGEGYGRLGIEMDPRKRGSSELKIDFHGRNEEDPRAFGSDGHLDSLGLCIFLAFVRRFNGDWPLLVLDDVVSSVDTAHKQRVSTLLFEEFGDRQLFITTHDSRWFNDLRRAQAQAGRETSTRNLVIDSWSLRDGPAIRPAP